MCQYKIHVFRSNSKLLASTVYYTVPEYVSCNNCINLVQNILHKILSFENYTAGSYPTFVTLHVAHCILGRYNKTQNGSNFCHFPAGGLMEWGQKYFIFR